MNTDSDTFLRDNPSSAEKQWTTGEPHQNQADLAIGDDQKYHHSEVDTFWDKCNSFWIFQLLGMTLSLACLGVVIWALARTNNKPLSTSWPVAGSLKLNTFVSIFITASKLFFLPPVAVCIAQLRWHYYLSAPRRLDHNDVFDSALRGPWGCFWLLRDFSISGKAAFVARWGAAIVILGLAMDPFAQQIIGFPIRNVPQTGIKAASIPATHQWSSHAALLSDASYHKAIFGGLLDLEAPIDFNCSTGNCEWDRFSSFGLCSSCQTVADTATRTCLSPGGILDANCTEIEYQIPDTNLTIILQNGSQSDLQGIDNSNGTIYSLIKSVASPGRPRGLRNPLVFDFAVAQLLVQFDGGNNVPPIKNAAWNLTACSLSWCAKVYEDLVVSNGTLLHDAPQDVSVEPLANSSCWNTEDCQEFIPTNISALPKGSNTTYYVPQAIGGIDVRNLMIFDYNVTASNSSASTNTTNNAYNIITSIFWNQNITATFLRVADAHTNFMRENSVPYQVAGTAFQSETFVSVAWRWFILPAALVLLAVAFLLAVMILTAVGVDGEKIAWKDSSLPLLLQMARGSIEANSISRIESMVKEVDVQLRRDTDGHLRLEKT